MALLIMKIYHVHGTDFNNSDSDEDGLSDYEELMIYGTNPILFDEDEDLDGWYWFEDCDDNNHMNSRYE